MMQPVLRSVFDKMRISAKIPRLLIYASHEKCGLGFPNIYEIQGRKHIKLAIEHLNTDTITGQSLDCYLEQLILTKSDANVGMFTFRQFEDWLSQGKWGQKRINQ